MQRRAAHVDEENKLLDKFYKFTKIVGIIFTILCLTGSIVATIVVGHTRIEEQQNQIMEIQESQQEGSVDRANLKQDINDLDKMFMEVKTDVKWIRETMERKQPN